MTIRFTGPDSYTVEVEEDKTSAEKEGIRT